MPAAVTPYVIYPSSLVAGADWSDITEVWDRDRLIVEYWDWTRRYIRQHWRELVRWNHMADWDELYGVALESLIRAAEEWPGWVAEQAGSVKLYDKGAFWGMVVTRIKWDVTKYIERRARVALSLDRVVDEETQTTFGEILGNTVLPRVTLGSSMLLRDIVGVFEREPMVNRMAVALYYFEDMPHGMIEDLLGVKAEHAIGQTAQRILNAALREVMDHPPKPLRWSSVGRPRWHPPAPIVRWLEAHYGISHPMLYVDYVATQFRADESYIVDIIWRARGVKRVNSYTTEHELTDRQQAVLDLMRAAAARGEPLTMSDIAESVTGVRKSARIFDVIEQLEVRGYLQPRARGSKAPLQLRETA